MTTSTWFAVLRDVTLLALGVFGILHQELTGQANPALLAVYTALLGIPGAANVIAIIRNGNGGSGPSSSRGVSSSPESVP